MNIIQEVHDDSNNLPLLKEIVKKNKAPNMTTAELINLIDTFDADYKWTAPRLVEIPKPNSTKKRKLFIFKDSDSYLLKVINSILYKHHGSKIHDCVFSYKKGTRTFDAAKHIQKVLNENNLFGIKLDISDYFGSVNKEAIAKAICELCTEPGDITVLSNIFTLDGAYVKDVFTPMPLGIMAGSAISAFFANYLLRDLDDYISSKAEVYARYSDDLIYFTKTEAQCDAMLFIIKEILQRKGLSINPKKISKIDSSRDTVTFLGLDINKNKIDITDDVFKQLKSQIKNIIKKAKTEKSAVSRINTVMYKNIFNAKSEHKSNRMHYIMGNITTDETLKKLDFYTIDRLRAKVTGKNNKANTRIPVKYFESLGYMSSVQLWNLFKICPEVYMTQISILGKSNSIPKSYDGYNLHYKPNPTRVLRAHSFEELYNIVISDKNNFFVINNTKVYPEYLLFDLQNLTIRVGNILIAEGNKLLTEVMFVNINGQDIAVKIDESKVSCCTAEDSELLIIRYLRGSFNEGYGQKRTDIYTAGNINSYFRKQKINDIIKTIDIKHLDVQVPQVIRIAKFLSYMHFHIANKALWTGLDYSKAFTICRHYGYTLVIKRDLLHLE